MGGAGEWWATLDEPWRLAFEEAWASWCSGSLGIGAVVLDADGAVAARGRNRILDRRDEPGVLAGAGIAHAEMNALGQVRFGPLDGYRVLTTLEPCVMCASAMVLIRMPAVEFVAVDPLFDGVHDHLQAHPFCADRPIERSGPWTGPPAGFASLLPLSAIAFWQPDGPVVAAHRESLPLVHRALEPVLGDGLLATVAHGGGSVVDALDAVWDLLAAP